MGTIKLTHEGREYLNNRLSDMRKQIGRLEKDRNYKLTKVRIAVNNIRNDNNVLTNKKKIVADLEKLAALRDWEV